MKQLLLLSSAVALLSTAYAQPAPADAPAEDVIIVTAQKRAQNISDVPLAITALDQAAQDRFGIQQFDDLADFVPGLQVQEQSANNPGFVIRGITSDSGEATIEPRVAIFENGTPISRSRGSFVELIDSQVEIVRGPQPTLFGRSALIGAINVTSVRPVLGEAEAKLRAGFGNEEFGLVDGYVNLPLGETAALRLAGRYKERDGYVRNLIGDDLNGFGTTAFRGSLRFQPVDRLDINLIGFYQQDDNPGTSFKSGTFLPVAEGELVARPGAGLDAIGPAALSSFGGLEGGRDLGLERDVNSVTLLVDLDLTDALTLSSVSNWREFDSSEVFDPDGFGLPLFAFAENAEGKQLFQELRLGFEGARLSGFVGASVFDEEGSQNVPLVYTESVAQALLAGFLFSAPAGTAQNPPPLAALPTVNVNPASPLAGAPLGVFAEEFTNFGDTTSYDIFADATFAVTPRFDVTAGLRYTVDEKQSGFAAGLPGGVAPAPALTRPTAPGDASAITGAGIFLGGAVFNQNQPIFVEEEYNGLTWRVAAQYDLTDDITTFVNYGHGRRPEVLAYALRTSDLGLNPARFVELPAEETDAYEVGVRGDLLGGALKADLVGYYYEYTNFQTTVRNASGALVPENGGNASGPGFEGVVEISGAPWVKYFVTYAYNGVEFDDTDENGNAQTRAGNRFRLAPEHSLTLAAEYQLDCSCGTWRFVPSYSHRSETFFDDDNDRSDARQDEVQSGYGIADLRVVYAPAAMDGVEIEAFVENIFDEEYLLDAGNTGDAFGIPTFIAGVPQMYGLYVSKKF